MSLASSLLASFAGKHYTIFRRVRARTPKEGHGLRLLVLLESLLPTLYSRVGFTRRTTCDAAVTIVMGAIITDSPCSEIPCEHTVKR